MSEPLFQPKTDLQARLLGAGAATVAIAILYWQIQNTIDRAREGEQNLMVSLSLIGLGEMFLALGTYWMLTGLAGYTRVRQLQSDPAKKKWIGLAAFVAVGLTWLFLDQAVSSVEYTH